MAPPSLADLESITFVLGFPQYGHFITLNLPRSNAPGYLSWFSNLSLIAYRYPGPHFVLLAILHHNMKCVNKNYRKKCLSYTYRVPSLSEHEFKV